MTYDSIERLIGGGYPDPDGGPALTVPTRKVAIERSLDSHEADLVRALGFTGRLAVVSDPRTREVLGARIERALESVAGVSPIMLQEHPHADAETVERIREDSAACDALVAVGSGTINDLCKYVAALERKPYAVFATAPSMNGYTSANAAITVAGHKKSLPAVSASGVFIDLSVFADAPARMIRSGLGDSICRPTAQGDWLLSHRLLDTPYRTAPFELLAADEPDLLDSPDALIRGDLTAMRLLARTLVLSGFGMTICGGSHPASQGEHLISHYIDMMAPVGRAEIFHGEQIAVTTLTMIGLQHALLAESQPPRLHPTAIGRDDVVGHFGAEIGESCWSELDRKRLDARAAEALTDRLAQCWSEIVEAIEAITVPPDRLRRVLERAGAPTGPAAIEVTPGFYADAVRHARELRNRYTFLDLAGDSGRLEAHAKA